MKKPLVLIGGGGHCKACIDVIEAEGKYYIKGILDTKDKIGTSVLDYKIIGDDTFIEQLVEENTFFLITLGQIKTAQLRKVLFQNLMSNRAALATVLAPSAIVSRYAEIGVGTIIMHHVIVNAGALVGDNVILNTGCLIEHDVIVGDHVHISTHAVLNGETTVEEGCFVGSNAVINQTKKVKAGAVIGAGSVVVKDIQEPGLFAGNPAKRID